MEPFCVVFLSTAGTVSELAPSQDVAPSIRERSDELELPSPFTELPFDVDLISEPLVPGKESIRSVGSLKFTVQFGRPMYVAPDSLLCCLISVEGFLPPIVLVNSKKKTMV